MLKRVFFTAACAIFAFGIAIAADISTLPNPLESAKLDQWVSYTTMGGVEQKQFVSKIEGEGDDRVITITMEMSMGGQVLESQEIQVSLKDARAEHEEAMKNDSNVKISDVKIEVNGKEIDGLLLESSAEGETTKMYMSEEIPITGIVKMENTTIPEPILMVKDYSK